MFSEIGGGETDYPTWDPSAMILITGNSGEQNFKPYTCGLFSSSMLCINEHEIAAAAGLVLRGQQQQSIPAMTSQAARRDYKNDGLVSAHRNTGGFVLRVAGEGEKREGKVETLTLPMQPIIAFMKPAMVLTIFITPLVMTEMIIPYEG